MPAIEIVEGGIDFMLTVYKTVCESYGHLTKRNEAGVRFRKRALKHFLGTIAEYEKIVLENKILHKDSYFPDYILEECSVYKDGKYEVDIEKYRKDYYATLLPDVDQETLCHEYLEGMQWVLSYYTKGVPNWDWCFKHHYAPFSATLAKHVSSFQFPEYPPTTPSTPFSQLLAILPPKSASLLPTPLDSILSREDSPLAPFCPEDFEVDLAGKRREWEGIALLPLVDYSVLNKAYFESIRKVEERERKKNITGKSFIYRRDDMTKVFKSFYGDLNVKVETVPIEI